MPFAGFSRETFDFLIGLRLNNEKAWFHAHKAEYEQYVKTPFLLLAEALSPVVQGIDPELDTRPQRALARIHRDTRFSKDKSPYRDHLWISFRPPQTPVGDSYGYFFEMGPETLRYGFGFYTTDRVRMNAFRKKLLAMPDAFLRLLEETRVLDTFALCGEPYKRLLKKDLPPQLCPWYNRKYIDLIHEEPTGAQALSPDLADTVSAAFLLGAALYHFIKAANGHGEEIIP